MAHSFACVNWVVLLFFCTFEKKKLLFRIGHWTIRSNHLNRKYMELQSMFTSILKSLKFSILSSLLNMSFNLVFLLLLFHSSCFENFPIFFIFRMKERKKKTNSLINFFFSQYSFKNNVRVSLLYRFIDVPIDSCGKASPMRVALQASSPDMLLTLLR